MCLIDYQSETLTQNYVRLAKKKKSLFFSFYKFFQLYSSSYRIFSIEKTQAQNLIIIVKLTFKVQYYDTFLKHKGFCVKIVFFTISPQFLMKIHF